MYLLGMGKDAVAMGKKIPEKIKLRAGGMTTGKGPEFNPHYSQKKKEKKRANQNYHMTQQFHSEAYVQKN